jgi:arsenate reductase
MAPVRVLFVCVANSARSQMAETLARSIFGASAEVASAGSAPTRVNPLAVRVLAEIGLDASGQRSKAVADLPAAFLESLDYVVALCAEEVCPHVPARAKKLRWPLPDPALPAPSEAEALDRFRTARNAIRERLLGFKTELGLL